MAKKLADKVTQEELVMALRIKEAFKDAFNGDDFMTNDFLKNLRDEVDTSPKNGTLDNIEIKALGMVLGNIANHLPEDGEKRKFIKKKEYRNILINYNNNLYNH